MKLKLQAVKLDLSSNPLNFSSSLIPIFPGKGYFLVIISVSLLEKLYFLSEIT